MEWIQDRWSDVTGLGSGGWLAVAAWAALALAIVALIWGHRQLQRHRQLKSEELRPHVVMFMEPSATDWHLVEIVVRNFGQSAAHDIRFEFANAPTVAQYEDGYRDGYPEIVELQLPGEIAILAPGQEWRTVWDSAMDRNELGGSIRSRFDGVVTYFDSPRPDGQTQRRWRKRAAYETKVVLDWATLQPVQRIELMTSHDLARREKNKLELLRSMLTYFNYASKETRPEVFRAEIERMNRAAQEAQERVRDREFDDTTVLQFPWIDRQDRPERQERQESVANGNGRNGGGRNGGGRNGDARNGVSSQNGEQDPAEERHEGHGVIPGRHHR